jgi:hypothetical protein
MKVSRPCKIWKRDRDEIMILLPKNAEPVCTIDLRFILPNQVQPRLDLFTEFAPTLIIAEVGEVLRYHTQEDLDVKLSSFCDTSDLIG